MHVESLEIIKEALKDGYAVGCLLLIQLHYQHNQKNEKVMLALGDLGSCTFSSTATGPSLEKSLNHLSNLIWLIITIFTIIFILYF